MCVSVTEREREKERERRVSEESVHAPETRSAEDSDNFLNLGWIWKVKKIGPLDFGAIFPYSPTVESD